MISSEFQKGWKTMGMESSPAGAVVEVEKVRQVCGLYPSFTGLLSHCNIY